MTGIPATCELWVDGVRYADAPGPTPAALTGVRVSWGRDNTLDQPDPAQCQFTLIDPGGAARINDTIRLGSTVVIWSELDGTRVPVFGGRVTDVDIGWADGVGGVGEIIASDQLADLANRFVGDEPWSMEPAISRATRILTAVGVDPAGLDMPVRPAGVQVTRKDVDRQPAAALLEELAQTTATVLWSAYSPDVGQYLRFEDPTTRASLRTFEEGADGLWRPTGSSVGFDGTLDSAEVLRDPVVFTRSVTDLITRVAVRWMDQTGNPDPVERSETVIVAESETVHGARGLSVGTDLTSDRDALTLANAILAGHQPTDAWRVAGLSWDLREAVDPATRHAFALVLLDNTTRPGLPITLTGLPYWAPNEDAVQLYIEGGTYTYENRWLLELNASPSVGIGLSMSYEDTDRTVRYVDVDPTVTYLDMTGVGAGAPTSVRWVDLVGPWSGLVGAWEDL